MKRSAEKNAVGSVEKFFSDRYLKTNDLAEKMGASGSLGDSMVCMLHMMWPALLIGFAIGIVTRNGFFNGIVSTFIALIIDLISTNVIGKNLQKKIKFYNECNKIHITDLSKPYQREKAKLIAERLGCGFSDIEKYYTKARAIVVAEAEERQICTERERLSHLREEEEKACAELERFTEYVGREKRVAILQYAQKMYREKARKMRDTMKGVLYVSQAREINPGSAGGFASGFAGPAAGLAAYIDAENYNAKVRDYNSANLALLMPAYTENLKTVGEFEAEAGRLQRQIDDAKIKIVSDVSTEMIYPCITIETKCVTISETGTFHISSNIRVSAQKDELKVYGKCGVVDGVIQAEMYQNDKKVGSALMALPTYGVRDSADIFGMSLGTADAAKPYEIRYSPYHLWVMEP